MVKCGFPKCENPVSGGFDLDLNVGHSANPKARIDSGSSVYWCDMHESDMEKYIRPPGRYRTQKDLDSL